MKTIAFALAMALLGGMAWPAAAEQSVRGYTRRDGTYVAPHWRSTPDRSYNNNWSTSPNVNPFTGQQGTRQPTWNDRAPEPSPWRTPSPRQSPSPWGR
jgi:hypothetical protein